MAICEKCQTEISVLPDKEVLGELAMLAAPNPNEKYIWMVGRTMRRVNELCADDWEVVSSIFRMDGGMPYYFLRKVMPK